MKEDVLRLYILHDSTRTEPIICLLTSLYQWKHIF